MNNAYARLLDRLKALGVNPVIHPYPAHRTVEEGKALRGAMTGTFTKNLLLKDKKGRLYLMVAPEDRSVNLRTLHTKIGASGRVGLAAGDQMRTVLGVEPGALTPLAALNDIAATVTIVLDTTLLEADQLNFHPLVQTQSMGIHPRDLLSFIRSCGRKSIVVDLEAESPVRRSRSLLERRSATHCAAPQAIASTFYSSSRDSLSQRALRVRASRAPTAPLPPKAATWPRDMSVSTTLHVAQRTQEHAYFSGNIWPPRSR
jgi:Ala-tRNA(Pro) deacylase